MWNRRRYPKTSAILGAAFEVHSVLGSGYLERVYHEALALELGMRNIPFKKEIRIPIRYKGCRLHTRYRADFLAYGDIIVELKSMTHLKEIQEAQLMHYLKGTGFSIGLLLNFGTPSLQYRRLFLSKGKKSISYAKPRV